MQADYNNSPLDNVIVLVVHTLGPHTEICGLAA